MATPTYLKGKKSIKVGMHSLIEILGEVDKLGHSEQLHAHLSSNDAVVSIPPKTVNLIKDYLSENKLDSRSEIAKRVMNSEPNSDPDCCGYVAH